MRALLVIAFAGIAAFASAGSLSGGTEKAGVSFSGDIVPVLTRRCAVCHITGEEPGLMSLVPENAYASLVGVDSQQSPLPRVQPGAPQESYLYRKLTDSHVEAGGEGAKMPFGSPPLPDNQIELFRRWIESGAPDN